MVSTSEDKCMKTGRDIILDKWTSHILPRCCSAGPISCFGDAAGAACSARRVAAGEKQDIVFHNYFMQDPASNQQPARDSGDRGLWSEVGKMKRKNNGTQKRKLNHRLNVNDIVIGMLRPIESILAELPCTSCRLHNGQNILECYEGAV